MDKEKILIESAQIEAVFNKIWRESNYPDYFNLPSDFVNDVIIPAIFEYRKSFVEKLLEVAADEDWQQEKFGRDVFYVHIEEIITGAVEEATIRWKQKLEEDERTR